MKDNGSLLWIILASIGAIWWFNHCPVTPTPGQTAPNDPIQTEVHDIKPWAHKGFTITPLMRYEITARILHRQEYHFDEVSNIAPLDLALGWGPLSDPQNYRQIHFSQEGRWYEYSYDGSVPGTITSRLVHCTKNHHLIPADDDVKKELLALRENQTVRLKGYLIEATNAKGYDWRSSLLTDDTGGGSCKVVWVDEVEVRP